MSCPSLRPFISLCRCRVEHGKVLDSLASRAARSRRGKSASSDNRPPDILPAVRNCEGFTRKQPSKQGLNHENLQIIYCTHTHLLRAFTEDARRRAAAPRGLSQLHHCCGGTTLFRLSP